MAVINCRVLDIRPVRRGLLIAVASVEIGIDGLVIGIEGVQVFRFRIAGDGGEMTGVGPPRYRTADGQWREAVRRNQGEGGMTRRAAKTRAAPG